MHVAAWGLGLSWDPQTKVHDIIRFDWPDPNIAKFLCRVTDFLAAEKGRGVKFCMRVGLLSGQVFFPLVNFSSRRVTGAAALLPG